jgi:hypothetical protein
MSTLIAPDWSETFIQTVETDVSRLISNQLWPVDSSAFGGWYSQFGTRDERFFAAALLQRMTLRTKKQFSASLQAIYRGSLNQHIFPDSDDLHLVQFLSGREDPRIRLVPVLRESDSPTKSGVIVLRRLQRLLRLNPKWIVWPWQAAEQLTDGKIETIVFVDDFLGSGKQFEKFFKEWEFLGMLTSKNMIYSPVVAHAEGLKHLSASFPDLQICQIETLDSSSHFFHEDAWKHLSRGEVSADAARAWYLGFAQQHSLQPKNIGAFGVGDLALTFGFEHSTPNNSLPILWYSGSNWCALLDR